MNETFENAARALAIGIGGVELIAGIIFAVVVAMIAGAVDTPDMAGGTLLSLLATMAVILPAAMIGLALFSSRRSAGYLSLGVLVAYPAMIGSLYVAYS